MAKLVTKITVRNIPIIFENDKEMDEFKQKIAKALNINPSLINFNFKDAIRSGDVFRGGL